ncbi:helix-turn-helix domain-containing protein [Streptomyces wuyuanensis]|uniref:helix-turn-helix domain-containing protein n=1 Tax=Streptomyces wuyuanensis TaxID=1196353 RepID=UPI00344AEC16
MYLRDQQRFIELMNLQGISQRSLAQKAHVTQAFISLMAHGHRGVRPETAWRIARALGVHTQELFTDVLPLSGEEGRLLHRDSPVDEKEMPAQCPAR